MAFTPPAPSLHRLRLGLPGFLIPFAPLAFASERQGQPRRPPSPLVFLPISTHFTTTPGIPPSSTVLKSGSFERPLPVEPGAFTSNLPNRLHALYAPKAFIAHAALLHQAFAHCAIFPTAATRRCLARVSVPMWGATLSGPLPVVALVGRYPTNKLMGRRPLPERFAPFDMAF